MLLGAKSAPRKKREFLHDNLRGQSSIGAEGGGGRCPLPTREVIWGFLIFGLKMVSLGAFFVVFFVC